MSRGRIFIAVSVALVLLLATSGLAIGEPQISIKPHAGYVGQKFMIECTGFYPGDHVTQSFYWPCGTLAFAGMLESDENGDVPCWNWTAGPDEPTGVYRVTVSGVESGDAEATFEVLAEEFVPEPGSVILLGSGLMGLAGYAGLRFRSRRS
jgi:hypothetical protein